jgi:hypothetical protein
MTKKKTGIFVNYNQWSVSKRRLLYIPPHFHLVLIPIDVEIDIDQKYVRHIFETIDTQTVGYWWSDRSTDEFKLAFEDAEEAAYISLLFK